MTPTTPQISEREIEAALQAIADGFDWRIEPGFVVVENPDGDAEGIALRGENPNLVIPLAASLVREQAGEQGWQIVPINATNEMLDAACGANHDLGYLDAQIVWAAMLAAAPQSKGEAGC